jgi:hypothetical protein
VKDFTMRTTASALIITPAMAAGKDRAQRMSCSMPAMCMAAAIASSILIETDVMTAPVSFITRLLTLSLILSIVLLGILITLALSGLTGLDLINLVGLKNRPARLGIET